MKKIVLRMTQPRWGVMLHFSPYFTFTPPSFHHDYLMSLLQGHMAIHDLPLWLIPPLSLTRLLLIYDSIIVRGHPVSHNNRPHIKMFQSAHPCSDDAIITSHNRPHIEPLDPRLFAVTMVLSQVTIGHTSKPFDPWVPIFPLIIVQPLLVR